MFQESIDTFHIFLNYWLPYIGEFITSHQKQKCLLWILSMFCWQQIRDLDPQRPTVGAVWLQVNNLTVWRTTLLLLSLVWSAGRYRKRNTFCPLIQSPNGHSGWARSSEEPGTPSRFPTLMARAQVFVSSSSLTVLPSTAPVTWAGRRAARTPVGTLM